ncbi:hypothetical protein PCANC_24688 [Puccinia coronata f. sp. avenae]|nr:hypothetical protein PCANC_26505 [Puccinia coronata f. sp. avenae]PLW25673.1 hypothetical protein PCANC_24688 [Puccinia coronata f. sp. avenae]
MCHESSSSTTPLSHVLQGGYAHPLTQSLQAERSLTKDMLMFPIFISDNPDAKEPIDSFPNQYRLGLNVLEGFLRPLIEKGLQSVILFGVPMKCQKDARGTPADDATGPTISAIILLKSKFPSLFVAADVCLCEYTDHGHCGFAVGRPGGEIDTIVSVDQIAEVALSYA